MAEMCTCPNQLQPHDRLEGVCPDRPEDWLYPSTPCPGIREDDPDLADDIARIEAAAAEAERARIRAAVEEIIAVLGPTPPDCGCEGCRVEMQMALDNARAVLAAIDAPDATPDSGPTDDAGRRMTYRGSGAGVCPACGFGSFAHECPVASTPRTETSE